MNDIITSVIRTLTPIVAGWILALPVTAWLDLDQTTVTAAVSGGLAALYHGLIRVLETRWPAAGRLLGTAHVPENGPADRVMVDRCEARPAPAWEPDGLSLVPVPDICPQARPTPAPTPAVRWFLPISHPSPVADIYEPNPSPPRWPLGKDG